MVSIHVPSPIFSPQEIFIPEGITVIAGANNAGKTTLLRSLRDSFENHPQNKLRVQFNEFQPMIRGITYAQAHGQDRFSTAQSTVFFDFNLQAKVFMLSNGISDSTRVSKELSDLLGFSRTLKAKYYRVSSPLPAQSAYSVQTWNNLDESGKNLASCLANLHEEDLHLLRDLLKDIFTDVEAIETKPTQLPENPTEIRIRISGAWKSLADCGSGLSQGLFLLYVTVFAPAHMIVLIDEAFEHMHPSATKEILRLIKDYSKAYAVVLGSHDPAAIRSPYIEQVVHISRTQGKSTVRRVDQDGTLDVVRFLGLENSDLAFAERILLGEGPTEERIFEYLLRIGRLPSSTGVNSLLGLSILDANRKLRQHTFHLTSAVIKAAYKTVIPIQILIDRDDKTTEYAKIIEQDAQAEGFPVSLILLKRREIENYFLDLDLLKWFILEHLGSMTATVPIDALAELFNNLLKDGKYYPNEIISGDAGQMSSDCKGSKVIEALCNEFIPGFTYNKPDHGLQLFSRGLSLSISSVKELESEILGAVGTLTS